MVALTQADVVGNDSLNTVVHQALRQGRDGTEVLSKQKVLEETPSTELQARDEQLQARDQEIENLKLVSEHVRLNEDASNSQL